MKSVNLVKNESGVAILMVLTSVAILAFLLADFSFETKVNQLKVYNQQDQLQARLNAEAGLSMAMSKLRLYQEARNLLEKNENLKGTIQPSMVESLLLQPFAYPVPLPPGAGGLERSALDEFESNVLFDGELILQISQVSGFLNPNNLRLQPKASEDQEPDDRDQDDDKKKSPDAYMEGKLLETLQQLMEDRREIDQVFDIKYGNLDPELLIKELKYYVNDPEAFQDVERGEIEARYLAQDIIPKHAPLSSIDEMHLLIGWPDEIVTLIKPHLTVHEVSIIAVNELTVDQLKILFPDITPIQIEEFFKHKNGDPDLNLEPQEFKSADDFKQVIVSKLGITGSDDYDSRIKEFEQAGVRIDVAGKLYRVESSGKKGRAVYNLVAIVDMPIKPTVVKTPTPGPGEPNPDRQQDEGLPPDDQDDQGAPPPTGGDGDKPKPQELLLPRVVEIRIE